jgi:DNA-binding NarL/FixJ family response regulator
MDGKPTKVIVVDDHDNVRQGIRGVLNSASDIEVIGEARNGIEAMALIDAFEPDVVLLDVEMPKMNGRQVARKITQRDLGVRILALSAHDDNQYILGMLKSGAAGYLTKDEVPALLVKAVRGVARGEDGWVSKRVSKRISSWGTSGLAERPTLTQVELQILRLLAEKQIDDEIARQRGISVDQVRQSIENLCEKYGAISRVDLIVRAKEDGLV